MNNTNGQVRVGDLLTLVYGLKEVYDHSTALLHTYPPNSLFLICALDFGWDYNALLLCPDGKTIHARLGDFRKVKFPEKP